MKLHLVSLGCARNQVDSEIMLGRLRAQGVRITLDPEAAQVIVVNTCSFIAAAANESIDTILALAAYKTEGVCRRLIVVGCLPERYREDIAAALPEVDLFLGTGAFDQIVRAVMEASHPGGCLLPTPNAAPLEPADVPRVLTEGHSAYLKIAEGCSSRCTYCIIPRLRGSHRSRPMADILTEARRLIAGGVKELVLVAQDTSRYGFDLTPPSSLHALLDALASVSGDIWIRVLYGHPEHFDPAVVETMAAHGNICAYFDMPVQHASDRILKRMGRRYTAADLHRMFSAIKQRLPHAALRTSLIVGFPGETEDDMRLVSAFIDAVGFHHVGVFTYSDAEDLASHRLSDHVPAAVAGKRRRRLMNRQKKISLAHNRAYVGRTMDVLLEQRLEETVFSARTRFQAPEVDGLTFVHVSGEGPAPRVGTMVRIRVTDALEYDLVGELLR